MDVPENVAQLTEITSPSLVLVFAGSFSLVSVL